MTTYLVVWASDVANEYGLRACRNKDILLIPGLHRGALQSDIFGYGLMFTTQPTRRTKEQSATKNQLTTPQNLSFTLVDYADEIRTNLTRRTRVNVIDAKRIP